MKKRFVGPANPGLDEEGKPCADVGHEVNVAGRYVGNVKSGDVIDVPDELVAGSEDAPAPVWSDELWEDVKDSPKAKKGEDR